MRKSTRIGWLLFFTGICLGTLWFTHMERIRLENVIPTTLYAVVNTQVEALRLSDFPTAYELGSSEFKRKYPPSQFAALIRRESPELLKADHVEYGPVICNGQHAVVRVYCIHRKDRSFAFTYTLVHERFKWKIEKVQLRQKKEAEWRLPGISI